MNWQRKRFFSRDQISTHVGLSMNGAYLEEIPSMYLVGRVLKEGSKVVVREGIVRRNLDQVAMKFVKKAL